jgi:hypothetical protein
MADQNQMDEVFAVLVDIIHKQRVIMDELAIQIKRIDSIGGGGGGGTGNGFEVYESGKTYKKYQALIDPNTDIPYLVVPYGGATEYISDTVENDCAAGNLRLLGYDGQIVTFNHPPQEPEIDRLPENVVVVEYNDVDPNYNILTSDNTTNSP